MTRSVTPENGCKILHPAFPVNGEPGEESVTRELLDLERERDEFKSRYEDLKKRLDAASGVLNGLLKVDPANLKIQVAYRFKSLDAVGGDFLDIRNYRDGCDILFADVAGHDLGASYYAVVLKTMFAENCRQGAHGITFFRQLNTLLLDLNRTGRAVTALFVRVNLKTMELEIVSAAHPPLYFMASGASNALAVVSRGSMLGVDPDVEFEVKSLPVEPGDRLFLYTDGFSDLFRNREKAIRSRLARAGMEFLIQDNYRLPLDEMVERVFQHALTFCSHKVCDDTLFLGAEIPQLSGGRMAHV